MQNRVKSFFIIISVVITLLFIELLYLNTTKYNSSDINQKNNFVKLIGLPDLAISTEANYIRHRSLNSSFTIFSDGPEHIEYFPSTFVISHGVNSEK